MNPTNPRDRKTQIANGKPGTASISVMGMHVARETIKLLIKAGKAVRGARVLVLGVTFKPDVRGDIEWGLVGLQCLLLMALTNALGASKSNEEIKIDES